MGYVTDRIYARQSVKLKLDDNDDNDDNSFDDNNDYDDNGDEAFESNTISHFE